MHLAVVLLNSGDCLKIERERLGMTQMDIAELASVSKTTQFNYEKDARSPDGVYLAAVAAADVDVLYLITGQRTPSREEGLREREKAVLDNYRALPEFDQAAV